MIFAGQVLRFDLNGAQFFFIYRRRDVTGPSELSRLFSCALLFVPS